MLYLSLALVVILVLIGFYTWASLSFSYSSGEKVGYVQTLAKSGWFCKTWEGEIYLISQIGVQPEKFRFSVRDEKIAEQITAELGKKVSIHYNQHIGVPSSCFGETEFFVDKITPLPE